MSIEIVPEPMVYDGSFIELFVHRCKSLEEAQRSLPELTRKQYAAIRAGKAHLSGDTKVGINYEPRPRE